MITLVALAGLAVALWQGVRRTPAIPVAAGLGLSVFSGWGPAMGLAIPADRIALAGGLVIAVALRHGRPALEIGAVHVALYIAAGIAVVSTAATGQLHDSTTMHSLLDSYGLVPFATFVCAPLVFRDERDRDVLLAALVITGAYLALTAVLESLNLPVWPAYIRNPALGIHFGRARGPFLEAVTNGMALFACAVGATMAAARWQRRLLRRAAWVVVVGCLVGTVLTVTRSIWVGSIVGLVAAFLVDPRLRRRLPALVAAGVVGVVLLLMVVPGLAGRSAERTADERSVWDRLNSNRAALAALHDHPLTGIGYGRFPSVAQDYFRQADTYPLTGSAIRVHNVFLSRAVELGLIGAAAWTVALALAVFGALARPPNTSEGRLWYLGLVAVAAQWLVIANLVPLAGVFPSLLLWMWAGVARAAQPAHARVALAVA